ncbi:MAG: hypothetical protein Q9220_006068 [cf. Caloplaca sp. 1 TL-2023]
MATQLTGSVSPPASLQHDERDLQRDENESGNISTQDTGNNTISTYVDSDPEGDTMNTQQTAATELSLSSGISVISHAETLRLRLRFALYKVQTNQIHVPLSQLRFPSQRSHESRIPSTPSSASEGSSKPRLLPAAVLEPSQRPNRNARQTQITSSSPASDEDSPPKVEANAVPRPRIRLSQQISSPPDSHNGEQGPSQAEDRALNSSAVKGHAAISLLDLRGHRR